MSFPKHVVIVEDEAITQRYLQDILLQQDVHISGCFDNAHDTLEALGQIECDMILMDINIKGAMDGIQLARKILQTHTLPIVFITAHSDDATLEELLELAPYGFIGKPFSSKEVLVTVQIAFKRFAVQTASISRAIPKENASRIMIGNFYCYSTEHQVLYYDGQAVKLNKKQGLFIELLVQNINTTVRYDTLIAYLWKDDFVSDSTLRTLVYSVRKLLPDLPIVSYSKIGYALEVKTS